MKIFTIDKWDTDSGLTHYATTWKITKKKDRSDVVVEVLEDSGYLVNWSVNLQVPVGEVYYLHVLRHLKDSNGNVVAFDTWIGPKKILGEVDTDEILFNKTYISDPYISNLEITYDEGLKITLDKPESNVRIISTNYIITDADGKTIVDSINDSSNLYGITIPNTNNLNFTTMDKIFVFVSFNGDLNTFSSISRDSTSYASNLYSLEGALTNVNVDGKTLIKISPKNSNFLNVDKASLLSTDMVYITDFNILNNDIDIMFDNFKFSSNYILALDVRYKNNADNSEVVKTTYHFLSTAKKDEYIYFSKNIKLDNSLVPLSLGEEPDKDDNIIISEQSSTGIIPMIKNNEITLNKTDVDGKGFRFIKNTGISTSGNIFKFEFLPENRLVFFYNDSNNKLLYKIYDFNQYDNSLSLIAEKNTQLLHRPIYTNSFALIDDKYYIFSKDGTSLKISYIDLKTLSYSDYKVLEFPEINDLSRYIVQLVNYGKVAILPQSSDAEVFVWIYDFKEDEVYRSVPVNTNFKNVSLIAHSLPNGEIAYFKSMDNSTPHDLYGILNISDATFKSFTPNLNIDGYFKYSVRYRSGEIDKSVINADNKEDIYRFM